MEIKVTLNMLPDLLASSALLTLAIYHFMIYWGRRKDTDERYNLYFAFFVLSVALLLVALYFQPQYFLFKYKPPFINVINIEMFSVWLLFFSGIKFFNLLLNVPARYNKFFYILTGAITLNFLSTFTSNFISDGFYYSNILTPLLGIVAVCVVLIYIIYGYWLYTEKLYRDSFVMLIFFGFVLLTTNIFIYRTIELNNRPNLLIPNHYFTAFMLYVFAYALSVKFNKEHRELKELKISLEKKVIARTEDLSIANKVLGNKNIEIEQQKLEILSINNELLNRANELKELDELKSRFFTNISHEFRTPLTLIIGPLELLIERATNDELNNQYELMLRQAKRLLALINQLLELSKLQKSMMKLELETGNINAFIRTLVAAYSSFAGELKVKLHFVEQSASINMPFDKDKIEKIVTNLISNALKFTDAGGEVKVVLALSQSTQLVEIIVTDTGIGIDADKLTHIFDPFYQTGSNSNKKFEGSGIGLALVKELVGLHQGNITVKSKPNLGTEFFVQLPVNSDAYHSTDFLVKPINYHFESDFTLPQPVTTDTKPAASANNEKNTILLVDDNVDMRLFISGSIADNYHIIEAANGAEGFEKATLIIPDLIISDVMMPIMNGLEFAGLIKNNELTSHIPIILLTAKASESSKIEGLETHADDYITKPFNVNELKTRIRNLINNRQMLIQKFSKNITVNPTEIVAPSVDERFLQKALAVIEKNMSESDYTIDMFCSDLIMSRTQVHRKLTALTGQSATEFIRNLRLKRAAQLLKQKAGSVSEIAFQTGFNNLSYFTKSFKEFFGVTPSEFNG